MIEKKAGKHSEMDCSLPLSSRDRHSVSTYTDMIYERDAYAHARVYKLRTLESCDYFTRRAAFRDSVVGSLVSQQVLARQGYLELHHGLSRLSHKVEGGVRKVVVFFACVSIILPRALQDEVKVHHVPAF